MPCNFVRPVGDAFDRQQFRVLATVKYEHPIFAPFKEPNHGDFGKARFYRLFQSVPTENASIIASYDDGSPALFEKPYGEPWTCTLFYLNDRQRLERSSDSRRLFAFPCMNVLNISHLRTWKLFPITVSVIMSNYRFPKLGNENITRNREVAIFNPNNVETRLQRQRRCCDDSRKIPHQAASFIQTRQCPVSIQFIGLEQKIQTTLWLTLIPLSPTLRALILRSL